MRLSIVKYCFYIWLASPVLLSAQADNKEPKGSLNGYMKTLQSATVLRLPNPVSGGFESAILSNNLIHNRLNYSRPLGDKIRFNASLRNRFFYGDIGIEEVLLKQLNQGNDYFDLSLEAVNSSGIMLMALSLKPSTSLSQSYRDSIGTSVTYAVSPMFQESLVLE